VLPLKHGLLLHGFVGFGVAGVAGAGGAAAATVDNESISHVTKC